MPLNGLTRFDAKVMVRLPYNIIESASEALLNMVGAERPITLGVLARVAATSQKLFQLAVARETRYLNLRLAGNSLVC
jgi:hypothetical protein